MEPTAIGGIFPGLGRMCSRVAAESRGRISSGSSLFAMHAMSFVRMLMKVTPLTELMGVVANRWNHRKGVRSGPAVISRGIPSAARAMGPP